MIESVTVEVMIHGVPLWASVAEKTGSRSHKKEFVIIRRDRVPALEPPPTPFEEAKFLIACGHGVRDSFLPRFFEIDITLKV